jgi:hypothetical protein
VIAATEGVPLDHETPLVNVLPSPLLFTAKADTDVVEPSRTVGLVGLMLSEVSVGGWKNPLHPAPNAATSSTVKAIVSGSFFPANLRSVAINALPRIG